MRIRDQMSESRQNVSSAETMIKYWLEQREEDKAIKQFRAQSSIWKGDKRKQIRQISQKLNRLERNFLREKQVKRQHKLVETVGESLFELDLIYKKAVQLISNVKERKQKEETKQVVSQIISLYNHSVTELTKRQKLEKDIKLKKIRMEQLSTQKQLLAEQKQVLKKEKDQIEAKHWLKMQNLKVIDEIRK